MSHLHTENQSSVVLRRAVNKVATECRNTPWTHEKILCGLTDILTHLRAADRGSQMRRGGFKKRGWRQKRKNEEDK